MSRKDQATEVYKIAEVPNPYIMAVPYQNL